MLPRHMLRRMGRRRGLVLGGVVVAVGVAATVGVIEVGGGGKQAGAGIDTAAVQRDMARRLPQGWTGRVTAGHPAGTYDVWLQHQGDAEAAIRSMHAHPVVGIADPAMLTLLPPGATRTTDFVFHLTDSVGDGDLIRAAAGPHHPGSAPVLLLASKEFLTAEISMDRPTALPTAVVIG